MSSGPAGYFDGRAARRREVAATLDPDALRLREDGVEVAAWEYAMIRREDAPIGSFRFSVVSNPMARIDISDRAFAHKVETRCLALDDPAHSRRAPILKIVGWSVVAAAAIIATVLLLVPIAAHYGADLVPQKVEQMLGDAVDASARRALGGVTCRDPVGQAALAKLSAALLTQAKLDVEARVEVLSSSQANAVALPGGRIYILEGLLRRAENPDEIAGVLAHEIGHVAHRDSLRRLIHAGATAYLVGLLFGDIGGAGMVVLLAQTAVETSYSRAVETSADRYAAHLMAALGRSAVPMGALIHRLARMPSGVPSLLRTHPVSDDRMNDLRKHSASENGPDLLTGEEWRALKGICHASVWQGWASP